SVSPLPKPLLSPPSPAQQPKPSSGGTAWFVAGVVLALSVGGYAAWQLSPRTRDAEPTEIEPGPGTTEHDGHPADDVDAVPLTGGQDTDGQDTDEQDTDEQDTDEQDADEQDTDEQDADEQDTDGLQADPTDPANADPSDVEPAGTAPDDPPGDDDLGDPEDPAGDLASEAAGELIQRAIAAARNNNYAESERLSRLALARSPGNGMAAYRLAVALYRQQRHEEALDWAQRSAHWDPRQPRAHSIQGDIYMRTGHFQSAAEAYQAALGIERNYGPAQRGLDRLRERGVIE
ncbi:MAG TPA: tetratricopeptide repeat protein, partial [Polyangiaceae bacterium]|nr:tetratricopeptide repeat protein [Polyangiaceae bacterium]